MSKKGEDEITFSKENFVEISLKVMNSKYIEKEVLYSGEFSKILRVKQRNTENYFVCKKLSTQSKEDVNNYMEEIKLIAKLNHPSIIKQYEMYYDNFHLYIIMEECKGGNLCDKIIALGEKDEIYTEKLAAKIFKQLMSALAYCHSQGVCHRNLKPENLLLATENDYSSIKLIDFSDSKLMEKGNNKKMKTRIGTSYYMSPEVILGDYDEKCDIWSAGVILYILLSGTFPFETDDESVIYKKILDLNYSFPDSQWSDVSDDAKDLIKHMLCKEEERYTAQQVLEHTWVKNYAPNSSELKNINIETFKNYKETNKLKKIALTYIASTLQDSDVKQLKEAFNAMDKDNNGTLSLDEMKEGFKKLGKVTNEEIEQIFDSIDTDKNGNIDYTEFLAMLIDQKFYLTEEKLIDTFKRFDKDGNGLISKREFKEFMKTDDAKAFDKYFKEIDLDGDGEIDFSEFLVMMRKGKPNK